MTKEECRKLIIEKRKQTNPNDIKLMNDHILDQIKNDIHFQQAKCVAIFYPMQGEVDLRELLKLSKKIALPKVVNQHMHFYEFNEKTKLIKSTFGVLEPDHETIIDDSIDYMLVPALMISKDFYRIGYGKGYYDQYLSTNRPKTVMGVIYDFQEVEEIPKEVHDQQLDGYFKGKL